MTFFREVTAENPLTTSKIEKGLIRRIEAILLEPPYGMPSGWSTWEEGLSDQARDVTGVK